MDMYLPEWHGEAKRNGDYIQHRGGCYWGDAPAPFRFHSHYAWTRGRTRGSYVERCPCGAIGDGLGWSMLDKPRIGNRWTNTARQREIVAEGRAKESKQQDDFKQMNEMSNALSELQVNLIGSDDAEDRKMSRRLLNRQVSERYREEVETAKTECQVEVFENADGTWHYRASYKGLILQGAPEDVASYVDRDSAQSWGEKRVFSYVTTTVVKAPMYLPY